MSVKSLLAVLLLTGTTAIAQVKSPGEFLGYPLGSKFTPHYRIVNYFNQAAAAMPQVMKLEPSFAATTARFIRIKAVQYGNMPDWHTGAGGASHIFVDEIEIE